MNTKIKFDEDFETDILSIKFSVIVKHWDFFLGSYKLVFQGSTKNK